MSQHVRALLHIDGRWEERDASVAVTNPVDGSEVGTLAWGSAGDAGLAADAAARALPAWASTTARTRADILHAGADLLDQRAQAIAELLAREAGKRLPEARGEVAFCGEYLRWFAEQARRPTGQVIPHEAPGTRHVSITAPVGVVASLSPWNFPCSIQARKLAPALAAGCTVVARVSEKAPLAVTEMVRCLSEAGLPPGVLNLVHAPAPQATSALLAHRAVRAVTFTGSTAVGRQIMAGAAGRIVRPLLELGGDAACIVMADADIPAAVAGALVGKFRNTGQSCIGINRFLVHAAVHEEFTTALVAAVDAMSIGDGLADPVPDLGPVIDDDRVRAVAALVTEALDGGARQLTAERELPGAGSWVAPALLADVPDGAALGREEVFGPVAGIWRFNEEEEAIAMANDTEMGLAAYVWTRDVGRAWRAGEALEAGIVGINQALPSVAFAPMGGVKQSGLGREGAAAGLAEFTDTRYLAIGL